MNNSAASSNPQESQAPARADVAPRAESAAASRAPWLVLVRDLLLASRITATARSQGVPHKLLRDPAALAAEAGTRAIVDLNLTGATESAAAWKASDPAGTREVIGFVSHVDAETIRRARDAHIDRVLPRSRFVAELEAILSLPRGTD